jgi:2-amino-4-hydroxy-6-hydroxymethyldihydropteridine diphosphokinase
MFHNLLVLIYLALGSNLGDRESFLRAAVAGLSSRGVEVLKCASIYSTAPRDVLDQPWFLNTVVEAKTSLEADGLLETCVAIEKENLRKRDAGKGPRTLDIDIIFYGNEIIRKPGLVVPHARFAGRRFVLEPLAEIASNCVDPVSRKTIRELLEATPDMAEVHRFGPPLC